MKALIALLLLVFLCGCSTFRALFDETPEETAARRNRAAARQAAVGEGQKKEFRDPVEDLLRIRRSKPAPVAAGFDLTEEERRVLENSLSGNTAPVPKRRLFAAGPGRGKRRTRPGSSAGIHSRVRSEAE